MAQADDQRWRSFADVIIHREAASDPVAVAARTLEELPGCVVVAVATGPGGCVVVARGRTPVAVEGPVDVEVVAAYWMLASLARASAALGSQSCS
jgi:hypothetical protein